MNEFKEQLIILDNKVVETKKNGPWFTIWVNGKVKHSVAILINHHAMLRTITQKSDRKLCFDRVSLAEAYRIIEDRMPEGLFFTTEDKTYVTIDNHSGDTWTEDYKTVNEILNFYEIQD